MTDFRKIEFPEWVGGAVIIGAVLIGYALLLCMALARGCA